MTYELNGIKYVEMMLTLAEKELIVAARENSEKVEKYA